ncbi:MAG: CHASE domain-containing protein [Thermostichus sp. DG02_5_bins_236]
MSAAQPNWIPASWLTFGLTLVIGLGATGAATWMVGSREVANHRLQFQRRTDNLTTALQRNLNRYTEVLLAMGDHYRVANFEVEPQSFAQFVERALATYPGIQALEWAPFVLHAEREAFEQRIQALGIPDFRVTERTEQGKWVPAAARDYYVPVTYVQPLAGNEVAVGFDLASDQTRKLAIETARETQSLIATARIRLVQEPGEQFGFLVFLPLIRPDKAPDYLLGVFRVSDVVKEALNELDSDINFDLYDHTVPESEHFLGFYDSSTQTVRVNPNQLTSSFWNLDYLCPRGCTQTLQVAGREWLLQFLPARDPLVLPLAALATGSMGILLTGMTTAYLRRSQGELLRTRELSDLKQRLFAMTSHELRTPLSTILISAQSLESDGDPPLTAEQVAKIHGRIRSSAKHMTQLLNDLLTLNRAEAGKLDFTPELVNLTQLCQQWIEEVQGSLESSRQVELSVEGDCHLAFLDPKLAQAIVINLLSNALKYSPPHQPVHVSLRCGSVFQIEVRDRGIGIPTQDQAHLFDTFYRGSNVGEKVGTGLGLTVAQTCARLHGGQITFVSEVGLGTTFTLLLPRVE